MISLLDLSVCPWYHDDIIAFGNQIKHKGEGYDARKQIRYVYYSYCHLTTAIDRIMAMGGSYVLNVGPDGKGEITEEYASRIRRIGDWYRRTESCLQCAEGDDFNYKIQANEYIATKKNGKTYLHFYNGIRSSSVALRYFPSFPKQVRLLNTGKELSYAIDPLPEYSSNGQAVPYLHVTGIPIDDLSAEPIILEIEW